MLCSHRPSGMCGGYERKSGDRQGVGVREEICGWYRHGTLGLVDTLGGFQYKIQTHLCFIPICFLFTTSCFRTHTPIQTISCAPTRIVVPVVPPSGEYKHSFLDSTSRRTTAPRSSFANTQVSCSRFGYTLSSSIDWIRVTY